VIETAIHCTILLTHAERRRLIAVIPAEHRFSNVSDSDFYTDLIPRVQFRAVSETELQRRFDEATK
jgi:hypothetical protein